MVSFKQKRFAWVILVVISVLCTFDNDVLAQEQLVEIHTLSPSSYSHWYGGGTIGSRSDDHSFTQSRDVVLGSQFSCEDYLSAFLVIKGSDEFRDQTLLIALGLDTRPSQSSGVALTLANPPRFNDFAHYLNAHSQDREIRDPGHQADQTNSVTLLEKKLLPEGEQSLHDSDEEQLLLEVRGIDSGEQMVVRLDLRVACAEDSRPRGDLRVKLKSVRSPENTQYMLGHNAEFTLRSVEGVRGLSNALPTMHLAPFIGGESTCPELNEIRREPIQIEALMAPAQLTICHYLLNRGIFAMNSLKLEQLQPLLESVSESSVLGAGEAYVINQRVTIDRSTRYIFELSAQSEVVTSAELKVMSELFIPFISLDDADGDGLSDSTELEIGTDLFQIDSDQDGLSDSEEFNLGSIPTDADSDDDGLIDSLEGSIEAIFNHDTDGDGIFDGTERGITEPHPDTDVSRGYFRADLDPDTVSDHTSVDSDGGGCLDHQEDPNLNGRVDANESDLSNIADDLDGDDDGLCDVHELSLGSDPNDADTDDDGVVDGEEPLLDQDTDSDGLITLLDPDSDNDGLGDGLELSVVGHEDTNLDVGWYVRDADTNTTTDPLNADSDGGGISDGEEDRNRNGRVDHDETDPLETDDDEIDIDGDKIPGAFDTCPTLYDPNQQDTDGDGIGDLCDDDIDGNAVFDGLTPQRPQSCNHSTDTIPLFLLLFLLPILVVRKRRNNGLFFLCLIMCITCFGFNTEALPLLENKNFAPDQFENDYLEGLAPGLLRAHTPKASWGANLNGSWSDQPLVLFLKDLSGSHTEVATLIENRIDTQFSMWSKVNDNWLFAMTLPVVAFQTRDRLVGDQLPQPTLSEPLSNLKSQGLGDLGVSTRYFFKLSDQFSMLTGASLTLPTGTEEAYSGDPQPSGGLNLAFEYESLKALYNLSFKHDFRSLVNFIGHQRQDLTQLGMGASWLIHNFDSSLNAIWGGLSLLGQSDMISREQVLGGSHHAAHSMLHLNYRTDTFAIQLWGSRALYSGISSPNWRSGLSLAIHFNKFPWYDEEKTKKLPPVLPKPPSTSEPRLSKSEIIASTDQDGDQIMNDVDLCPQVKGSIVTQGCPSNDMDGDQVDNKLDACPWTTGTINNLGCPANELAIPFKLRRHFTFEFGSAKLTSAQSKEHKKLMNLANFLRDHPQVIVHLSGHTDYKGQVKFNLNISRRRVYFIKKQLMARGIPSERIEISAFGEEQPIVYDSLHTQRLQNRRVTVTYRRITPSLSSEHKE